MTPKTKIAVLIADDHTIVRRGLASLLSLLHDIEVVAEAADGRGAVEYALQKNPDVVLMDINMPLLNGMEAARRIKRRLPATKVLMLSGYDNEELLLKIIDSGVDGYLHKTAPIQTLQAAIRIVHKGKKYFPKHVAGTHEGMTTVTADTTRVRKHGPSLTEREREILQLIAEGKTHQQIVNLLNISIRTVDTHRNNIMKKLDIHDTAGLVLYAVRNGIVIVDKRPS